MTPQRWLMCKAGCCHHTNEGYFKRGSSRLCQTTMPDSANRSTPLIGARLWFWFTSVCSTVRLHKQTDFEEGDEVQQKKCYNQSFCDTSSRPVICSHLPPHQTQAELRNKPPSIQWGSRSLGSRLWWKQPWHLMAVQEHMPNMSVKMIEGPNKDFIRCLSNIIDHARTAQVKCDWINSIFHCWWDQFPLSTRLIWQSEQATGSCFKSCFFISLSSCTAVSVLNSCHTLRC